MKKLLLSISVLAIVLFSACSSDDSDSSNNVPYGSLSKIESYFPSMQVQYNIDFIYDPIGRIQSLNSQTISSMGTSNNLEFFSYNSDGQIWKISKSNFNIEYTFLNGLIVSSLSSPSMYTGLYFYNDSEQLERQEIYDENGDLDYMVEYLYDNEGNIIERYVTGTTSYFHSYDYDTNSNPYYRIFQNQEIGKIYYEITPNNALTKTRTQNTSSTNYTYDYDYNSLNNPTTSSEYQNGNLVGQTTYTYQ